MTFMNKCVKALTTAGCVAVQYVAWAIPNIKQSKDPRLQTTSNSTTIQICTFLHLWQKFMSSEVAPRGSWAFLHDLQYSSSRLHERSIRESGITS
jgi:hypothetical protein